jgi:ankyrin repeat protein
MIASNLGVVTLESLAKWIPSLNSYIGGDYKQKLLFVPDADNKPEEDHEISEPALFRFLLNEETTEEIKRAEADIPDMLNVLKDIDKQSKITEFETHQSSMGLRKDLSKAFHVFIVFKTTSEKDGDYWWSLEKGTDYITLQRSRNKKNVKDKWDDRPRNKVKPIVENLKGKGTIQDLFAVLWLQQVIPENYHILKSNCQSFVTCISQQITEIGYEYEGFFNYTPRESGRDKKMLDLINILRGGHGSGLSPLFTVIKMGNIDLVNKMIKSGDYDINTCINEHKITPLQFAIMFSKTEMVKHLLKPPLNADPTIRDAPGRSALHVAAVFTMKMEIFDSLLAHSKVNVDDVDENGNSALHWAARISNVVAVQKLIAKGANPNVFDKTNKMSPLHMAAGQRDGIPIIDLLLEAQKVKGIGDVNDANEKGVTALHYAATHSNEITAEHLINKGANVNRRANDGRTPLHLAALGAKDMKIIDVLLKNITEGDFGQHRKDDQLFFHVMLNMQGLEMKICGRLLEKGIMELTPSSETDDCTGESDDEATGVNTRRFEDKGANPSIDLTEFDDHDLLIARVNISQQEIDEILKEGQFDINGRDENGDTPLIIAIRAHNVKTVGYLLKNGADPTIRNSKGFTPFHLSVDSDEFLLYSPFTFGKRQS